MRAAPAASTRGSARPAVAGRDIQELIARIRAPAGKAPRAQALVCRWLLDRGADQAPVMVAAFAVIGRDCGLSRRSVAQAVEALARRGLATVAKAGAGPYGRSIGLDLPPAHELCAQLSLLDLLRRRS